MSQQARPRPTWCSGAARSSGSLAPRLASSSFRINGRHGFVPLSRFQTRHSRNPSYPSTYHSPAVGKSVGREGEGKAFGWTTMPCGVSEFARGNGPWAGGMKACLPASTLPACHLGVVPFWLSAGPKRLEAGHDKASRTGARCRSPASSSPTISNGGGMAPLLLFFLCSLPQQKNSRREARAEKP